MPHVSVILPVYNGGAFLKQAVESILSQTYRDFELLALDDGSTDNSRAILEHFAACDERVHVISRPNKGLITTLNEGIELAAGTLIARMDADDIADPDRFAAQVAYLDSHPETVVLGGQISLMDGDGRSLCSFALPCDHQEIDKRHMQGTSVVFHPAVMMRTSIVRSVGGYDPRREAAEDFDLWLRLAEVGQLANLHQHVLSYRQHFQSICYSQRPRVRLSVYDAVQAAAERRGVSWEMPSPVYNAPVTAHEVFRKWGWWALNAGNVDTARFYAIRTLRGAPWDRESWRLLACALRGH